MDTTNFYKKWGDCHLGQVSDVSKHGAVTRQYVMTEEVYDTSPCTYAVQLEDMMKKTGAKNSKKRRSSGRLQRRFGNFSSDEESPELPSADCSSSGEEGEVQSTKRHTTANLDFRKRRRGGRRQHASSTNEELKELPSLDGSPGDSFSSEEEAQVIPNKTRHIDTGTSSDGESNARPSKSGSRDVLKQIQKIQSTPNKNERVFLCPIEGCTKVVQNLPKHLQSKSLANHGYSKDKAKDWKKIFPDYAISRLRGATKRNKKYYICPICNDAVSEKSSHLKWHGIPNEERKAYNDNFVAILPKSARVKCASNITQKKDQALDQTARPSTPPPNSEHIDMINKNRIYGEELREWYLIAGRKRWMVPEEVKKQDELVKEQVHLINSVFRFANKPFHYVVQDMAGILEKFVNQRRQSVQFGTIHNAVVAITNFLIKLRELQYVELREKYGVTIEDLRQAVEEGHGIQKSMTSVVMREATVNRMRKRNSMPSPADLRSFLSSKRATAAIKYLEEPMITDDIHIRVMIRNYLIIYLTITNACRTGNVEQFKAAQINAQGDREFELHNGEHFTCVPEILSRYFTEF